MLLFTFPWTKKILVEGTNIFFIPSFVVFVSLFIFFFQNISSFSFLTLIYVLIWTHNRCVTLYICEWYQDIPYTFMHPSDRRGSASNINFQHTTQAPPSSLKLPWHCFSKHPTRKIANNWCCFNNVNIIVNAISKACSQTNFEQWTFKFCANRVPIPPLRLTVKSVFR